MIRSLSRRRRYFYVSFTALLFLGLRLVTIWQRR